MFFKQKKRQKAVTASEYLLLFSSALMAVYLMSTFVKRALQGKIYDARHYMLQHVKDTMAEVNARGGLTEGAILYSDYEPYYVKTSAHVRHDETQTTKETGGPLGQEVRKIYNREMRMQTNSQQLPPGAGEGTVFNSGS